MQRAVKVAFAFAATTGASDTERPSGDDLKRARTWKPRPQYKGQGSLASANARLNGHLTERNGLKTKECEAFAVEELREVLRKLFRVRSEELVEVYSKGDGRHALYKSESEMEQHWAGLPTDESGKQRDAHCHEAVMWYIHHLTEFAQASFADEHEMPLLPRREHSVRGDDATTKHYAASVTCQACHVGGIANLGLPEEAPKNDHSKKRRCYTNYKELFGIECGPCDGIAGPYSGDDDKYFTETPCEIVSQPGDVPEAQRVKPKLPPQFTVDVVGGSDRFGRTTNPVHDQLPGPIAKLYGQIHGKWRMDAKPGADLWLLRHDTVYDSLTEDGTPIPFIRPNVTEIHAQTAKQRTENSTGPMVSLIHGMPNWVPGGCTCMPDPVGVPDTQASWAVGLANMQYMGRIKLPKLEYLEIPIELDHWASWFFHIFMDTNTSVPHYGKAPSRLASAYAGTAVYANWEFEDPAVKDPDVWRRGIPTTPERVGPSKGLYCMDTKKSPMCSNISQATFPPKGEPASPVGTTVSTEDSLSKSRLPFFPSGDHLAEHLARHRLQQELVV